MHDLEKEEERKQKKKKEVKDLKGDKEESRMVGMMDCLSYAYMRLLVEYNPHRDMRLSDLSNRFEAQPTRI